MPIEKTVQFLNVDLVIGGDFDRMPLAAALGKECFALHERVPVEGLESMVVEVNAPGLDLPATLDRLMAWVEALPRSARREWSRASRRAFDIGLSAGRDPHASAWSISSRHVAALAKLGAELVITVYGAGNRRPAARSTAERSKRRSRGQPRGK